MVIIPDHDLAIRDWVAHDSVAAKAISHVYELRMGYVRSIFSKNGFRSQELQMRAKTSVCVHNREHATFGSFSKDERGKLLRIRHRFFVAPQK